jgi:Domain of Unknown Function (DUF1206)
MGELDVRGTSRQVRRAAANPWLDRAERLGYVVRGLLYGVMGLLAFQVALGVGGRAVDQRGGLLYLTQNAGGKVALAIAVVGLAAYAVWGGVRAVFDPVGRGTSPAGLVQRLAYLWSGLSYAVIVLFGLQLLVGATNVDVHQDSVQAAVAGLLRRPAGGWLTVVAGAVAVAGGIAQLVESFRAGFRRDLNRYQMSEAEREATDLVGRLGYVGRGVTFAVVGWFLVQAGLHHDAGQAHGYGGAFIFLLAQPIGRQLLGATAICFVALGLHSFAYARWARTLASR